MILSAGCCRRLICNVAWTSMCMLVINVRVRAADVLHCSNLMAHDEWRNLGFQEKPTEREADEEGVNSPSSRSP